MPAAMVSENGSVLALDFDDGACLRFHAVWLRDNAWDRATRAPGNGQRLIALRDIPADTRITTAVVHGERLTLNFAPEDKRVDYDLAWLRAHAYDRPQTRATGWTDSAITPWDSSLMGSVPSGDFVQVKREPAALPPSGM